MTGVWIGEKPGDWWADSPGGGAMACDSQPDADTAYFCTRLVDHPGRHIDTTDSGRLAIAAWPGTHEPTIADLTAAAGHAGDVPITEWERSACGDHVWLTTTIHGQPIDIDQTAKTVELADGVVLTPTQATEYASAVLAAAVLAAGLTSPDALAHIDASASAAASSVSLTGIQAANS